jgi:hypothetical protein
MLSLAKPEIILGEESTKAARKVDFWLPFFALLGVLFLCYAPVLRFDYGFCDDFYYLARSLRTDDWLIATMREALLQGRPVDGLLLDLSFLCLHTVSGLVILRAVGIIGAACVAICAYKLLLQTGWPRTQSLCLAVCFVTIPAFQVYISWAVAASHVFPGVGAFLAVVLAERGIRKAGRSRALLLFAAGVCMFFSIGLYQPSAMFFWLFAAIFLFSPRVDTLVDQMLRERARLLAAFFAVFSFACALELGVFEGAKRFFGTAAVLPQRSHLTTHIAEKIRWFISGPLVDALNFQRLQPSSKVALLVFALITIGLLLYFKGNVYQRLIQWTIALCLIPLSYLPNLAIAEDFVTYRTEAGLSALLVFYAFLATVGIAQVLSKPLSRSAVSMLAVLAAGTSIVFASYDVKTFFVLPQTLELGLMNSQLAGNFGERKRITPVLLKRDDTLAPFSRYDEFGLPSLCQPWVPDPVVFLVKKGLIESRLDQNVQGSRSD